MVDPSPSPDSPNIVPPGVTNAEINIANEPPSCALLKAHDTSVPTSFRDERRSGTCVTSIVAHIRDDRRDCHGLGGSTVAGAGAGRRIGGRLRVMGLGAWTKFLSDAILRREEGGGGEEDDEDEDGSSSGSSNCGGRYCRSRRGYGARI